jgi:hypothetical protein
VCRHFVRLSGLVDPCTESSQALHAYPQIARVTTRSAKRAARWAARFLTTLLRLSGVVLVLPLGVQLRG